MAFINLLKFLNILAKLFKKIRQTKTFSVSLILFLEEVLNNTELAAVGFCKLQEVTVQKAPKYTKWTDENQYAIVKNASEHENAAAVRHFKNDFPNIKESSQRVQKEV